ncbi:MULTISPECIES: hypothetical protein [unclassified Paenibacillus]|uniref:hypothetical protein n=1 Tax=unclassified Paenibacillus TaxID=185978 RepID=UPI003631EFA6
MDLANRKITLYLLAGVATAPLFMEGLRQTMEARLLQDGWLVQSELLFPYGDWSRKLSSQLREMSHDLWRARTRPLRSIGGQRVAAAIKARGEDSLPLLIGHSGGGVAAVHAVQILADAGGAVGGRANGRFGAGPRRPFPHRIVQIGSPKCPIPEWMRESVLYAGALNAKGKSSDLITRLGSWSGWQRNERGLTTWSWKQFAPTAIVHIPVIGGHPDYFRESSPYLNIDGVPNMETTVQAIWDWFQSSCRPRPGIQSD